MTASSWCGQPQVDFRGKTTDEHFSAMRHNKSFILWHLLLGGKP